MSDKILKLSQAQTLYQDLRERIDALPTDSDIPEVPVQDVQVNGTSILSNGVANIPKATSSSLGVVKAGQGLFQSSTGEITTNKASSATIKSGNQPYLPIVPTNQHESVFYGLAKAAGDSTQSVSTNAVGLYTDDAKSAIQNMLGVPSVNDLNIYATKTNTVLTTTLSRGRKDNTVIGQGSVAFGNEVTATGDWSISLGDNNIASGEYSFASGLYVEATGEASHAEGDSNIASGYASHAEGCATEANEFFAHSEGSSTKANGQSSHAEGHLTIATGFGSHVGGRSNVIDDHNGWPEWASGTSYLKGDKVKRTIIENNETTIIGYVCVTANTDVTFTSSKWSRDTFINYAEIIGNGEGNNKRSNARTLDWDGNERLMGDVYVGCNNDSTGGTRLATVTEVAAKLDAAEAGLKVVRLI